MSKYYNPKRTRNLFEPGSDVPFRLSRSKLDLFLNCPRCFYIDRRLGTAQPPGYPFSLNSAVDALLKKEFDRHREDGTVHPIVAEHGLDHVPFKHEKMDEWRDSLSGGVRYLHPETNLLVTGGVDDIWVDKNGELVVVDYKATAKNQDVTLDADWQIGYKRQMELYQWLLRRNGFSVAPTGYFLYCNGDMEKDSFDKRLHFSVTLLPYTGDDAWVDQALRGAHVCLSSDTIPEHSPECDLCAYRNAVSEHEVR